MESLRLAAALWDGGGAVATIEAAMRELLTGRGVVVDYAAIVDAESLAAPLPARPAVALVAGRAGSTRLIDNVLLAARSDVG